MSDQLDDILKDLEDDESVKDLNTNTEEEIDISDDNVNEFILKKMGKLVDRGLDTIETIQKAAITGLEPDELNALSTLIQAVTKAADTINKVNIQNKKDKTLKQLKEMDITTKPKKLPAGNTTNNVLIATREEILNNFLGKGGKGMNIKDLLSEPMVEEPEPPKIPKPSDDEEVEGDHEGKLNEQ